MQTDFNPRATLGNNNPPPLEDILRDRHAPLIESVEAMKKRLRALPKMIETDKDSARYIGVVVEAGKVLKAVDTARTEEVEPHLRASQEINRVFNAGLRDLLAPIIAQAKSLNDNYLADKVKREREEQRKIAEALRLEAEAAAERAKAAEDAGANREADVSMSAAAHLEQQADAAEARASSSSNHLSQTVTASGAKASVSTVWVASDINRDTLDLEALRPFLSDDALEAALKNFIRAGRRSIRGANIAEAPRGRYR